MKPCVCGTSPGSSVTADGPSSPSRLPAPRGRHTAAAHLLVRKYTRDEGRAVVSMTTILMAALTREPAPTRIRRKRQLPRVGALTAGLCGPGAHPQPDVWHDRAGAHRGCTPLTPTMVAPGTRGGAGTRRGQPVAEGLGHWPVRERHEDHSCPGPEGQPQGPARQGVWQRKDPPQASNHPARVSSSRAGCTAASSACPLRRTRHCEIAVRRQSAQSRETQEKRQGCVRRLTSNSMLFSWVTSHCDIYQSFWIHSLLRSVPHAK